MKSWKIELCRAWRVDRLVRTLYREILGRGPADKELAARMLSLNLWRLPESLEGLVRQMVANPESATALDLRRLVAAMPNSEEARRVNYVVGLGTHCYTSAMLARFGLKRFSSPFDWIFSSLDMVAHCLDDDFRAFLDRSQYLPVPTEQRPEGPDYNHCEHAFYRDHFNVRYVFNHADPTAPETHAYLVRCVDRFRSILSSAEPKLFMCVTRSEGYSIHALQRVGEALARRTSNHDLLCVAVDPPVAEAFLPSLARIAEDSRSLAFKLRPVSQLGGVRFGDPVDEIAIARLLKDCLIPEGKEDAPGTNDRTGSACASERLPLPLSG